MNRQAHCRLLEHAKAILPQLQSCVLNISLPAIDSMPSWSALLHLLIEAQRLRTVSCELMLHIAAPWRPASPFCMALLWQFGNVLPQLPCISKLTLGRQVPMLAALHELPRMTGLQQLTLLLPCAVPAGQDMEALSSCFASAIALTCLSVQGLSYHCSQRYEESTAPVAAMLAGFRQLKQLELSCAHSTLDNKQKLQAGDDFEPLLEAAALLAHSVEMTVCICNLLDDANMMLRCQLPRMIPVLRSLSLEWSKDVPNDQALLSALADLTALSKLHLQGEGTAVDTQLAVITSIGSFSALQHLSLVLCSPWQGSRCAEHMYTSIPSPQMDQAMATSLQSLHRLTKLVLDFGGEQTGSRLAAITALRSLCVSPAAMCTAFRQELTSLSSLRTLTLTDRKQPGYMETSAFVVAMPFDRTPMAVHLDFYALTSTLHMLEYLEHLAITKCPLEDYDARHLALALHRHQMKHLKALDLSCNNIGDQGAVYLVGGTMSLPALTELDLRDNHVGTNAWSMVLQKFPAVHWDTVSYMW